MSGKRLKAGGQSCNTPPIYDEMVLKCFIYVSNKQIECLEQFQRRNSEEKKEMSVKATWGSIVRAVKAGGQYCNIMNIPPIYDEMVLKCLIYLYSKQIQCLGQF